MTVVDLERSERMGQRLARTALKVGFAPEVCTQLVQVFAGAMEPRHSACTHDHDPRWLHPGRSALILLLDVGAVEPAALALAMVHDSVEPGLSVGPEVLRPRDAGSIGARSASAGLAGVTSADTGSADADLAARLAELHAEWTEPASESEDERLLAASTSTRLAALAERLDHLRHAHLWPDPAARRVAHQRARSFHLPLAERTHGTLARRFAWWVRMFEERHLT